jgi:hypothetical protein
VKVRFAFARKEARTREVRKAVERDPDLELALGGQLKLPQWRHRDHVW